MDFVTEQLDSHTTKTRIEKTGSPLNYRDVLEGWQNDPIFREAFIKELAKAPFDGFRWETPSITADSLDRAFEYVLLDASGFARRESDEETFADYFGDDPGTGVVSFDNLRGDALMVVPTPQTDFHVYGHLAVFVREAPPLQVHALWEEVALCVQARVNDAPLWLSTAGGGVAWLHVRLDSRPKYYGYAPYRDPS